MKLNTMARAFFTQILIFIGSFLNGQATLNIHRIQQNNPVVFVPLSDIDSLGYSSTSPAEMTVYRISAADEVYPLSEVDSLTYSPGGVEGTPLVATRTPLLVQIHKANVLGWVLPPLSGGSDGSKGFCYGTSPLPSVGIDSIEPAPQVIGTAAVLKGLAPGTEYYVRAYSTNNVGTAYGNQVSFTTVATADTVSDIDGNVYETILYGDQRWFVQNLKTTRYRNGDPIPTGLSNAQWEQTASGAFAINTDIPIVSDVAAVFGNLYNHYAVMDTRGVCPTGWHVPTDPEWQQLELELGMPTAELAMTGIRGIEVGVKMKAQGDSAYWAGFGPWTYTYETNSSGFTALPGGHREWAGAYNYGFTYSSTPGGAKRGYWWTSSPSAWYRMLAEGSYFVYRNYNINWGAGYSVRCVED